MSTPKKQATDRAYRERRGESLREQKRNHYAKNSAAILSKRRAEYAENLERLRADQRIRVAAQGEAGVARRRAYYAAHKEVIREQTAAWKRANKPKVNAVNQKRRCLVAGADGFFTAGDIAEITDRQSGLCAMCFRKVRLTIDHIMPLALGGSNWPHNIQMLCRRCNAVKGARHPSHPALSQEAAA